MPNVRRRIPLFTLALLVGLLSSANAASAASLGQWSQTTSYPISVSGDSCVTFSDEIYCVGGYDSSDNSYSNVYYAPLTTSGIGSWSKATSYPTPIDSASCAISGTEVYCVGGEDGQTVLNDVESASISSSGLGSWSSDAAYPLPIAATSCVTYSGYIYCVGGFDTNGDEVNSAYYASLSSGPNSWTSTTSYPTAVDSESCVQYSGYIYCVAGEIESGGNPNNPINEVYYAQLNSSGIGSWSAAAAYPTSLAALSCVLYSSDIYCVGGFDINLDSNGTAYVGTITSPGVSAWTQMSSYPVAIDTSSCVADMATMYCVAGTSDLASGSQSTLNSAYYAPLEGTTTSTTTTSTAPEFPAAGALPITLAAALIVAVAALSTRNGGGSGGLRKP